MTGREATSLSAAVARLLPPFAIGVMALTVVATLVVAGETLGYDFLAYHAAAARVLGAEAAYDTSFQAAGGFGLFYYPPTFIPLVLVFGLVPAAAATWTWTALLLAAFAIGDALLPVSPRVRWLVVLLAAQSWPFLYAIKLGQVGPLLFLLFAAGWRWMDTRPAILGMSAGLGAAIKLQPGLILVWALLTRRWLAVVSGAAMLAALAALATLLSGAQAWADFLLLVGRVSDPITTPHNVTPGAIAYQLGATGEVASVVQWVSAAAAVGLVVVTALRLGSVPSYLVAVLASQLLSPILWDHYALLLLLPVSWLVDRGHWWAVVPVLATSVILVGVIPAWIYPVAFWVILVGVIAVGRTREDEVATGPAGTTAAVGFR
jgi:hypothetical protein